jgi:hypothetical protein
VTHNCGVALFTYPFWWVAPRIVTDAGAPGQTSTGCPGQELPDAGLPAAVQLFSHPSSGVLFPSSHVSPFAISPSPQKVPGVKCAVIEYCPVVPFTPSTTM